MSTTQTVTPVNGNTYYGTTGTTTAKSDLDMGTFLNLLVTQLQNQDPLNPMSDSDFYAQIAQLGTVQGVNTMTTTMNNQEATGLVGKIVTAVRPQSSSNVGTGSTITGLVENVVIKSGVSYLGIQDSDGNIVQVKTSAIQSVGDTIDMSAASNLIGKTIAGAYATTDASGNTTYTAVTGTVQSAYVLNGTLMLGVKDSTSTVRSVPMNTVSAVG